MVGEAHVIIAEVYASGLCIQCYLNHALQVLPPPAPVFGGSKEGGASQVSSVIARILLQ